jgi:hypothetical protein
MHKNWWHKVMENYKEATETKAILFEKLNKMKND